MGTTIVSHFEENSICTHKLSKPTRYYAANENFLYRTTTEFDDNPIILIPPKNFGTDLTEYLESHRGIAYKQKEQATKLMNILTFQYGSNPLDSHSFPKWLNLVAIRTTHPIYGNVINNKDNNYWICPDCYYAVWCYNYEDPSCPSCEHLHDLYEEGTQHHGRFLGQCQRCGELGPGSLTCTNCYRENEEEIKEGIGQQGIRLDDEGRRMEPFFNIETGRYGLDMHTKGVNYLHDEDVIAKIPINVPITVRFLIMEQARNVHNYNSFKYEHDKLERKREWNQDYHGNGRIQWKHCPNLYCQDKFKGRHCLECGYPVNYHRSELRDVPELPPPPLVNLTGVDTLQKPILRSSHPRVGMSLTFDDVRGRNYRFLKDRDTTWGTVTEAARGIINMHECEEDFKSEPGYTDHEKSIIEGLAAHNVGVYLLVQPPIEIPKSQRALDNFRSKWAELRVHHSNVITRSELSRLEPRKPETEFTIENFPDNEDGRAYRDEVTGEPIRPRYGWPSSEFSYMKPKFIRVPEYAPVPGPEEEVNMYEEETDENDEDATGSTADVTRNIAIGTYKPESWLFDTGATVHVTPTDTFLTNVVYRAQTIKVAEGTKVHSPKYGDLTLKSVCEGIVRLLKVLYVPEFYKNIISGHKLLQNDTYKLIVCNQRARLINTSNNDKIDMPLISDPNPLWYLYATREDPQTSVPQFNRRNYNSNDNNDNDDFNEVLNLKVINKVWNKKSQIQRVQHHTTVETTDHGH